MNGFNPPRDAPVFLLGLVLAVGCVGCGPTDDSSWSVGDGPPSCPGPAIRVIAVENQYGSLVSRLGGQGVRYKSIVTNPNADPHEFQTNFRVVHDLPNRPARRRERPGLRRLVQQGPGDRRPQAEGRQRRRRAGPQGRRQPARLVRPGRHGSDLPGDHRGAEGAEPRRVGVLRRPPQGLRRPPRPLPRSGRPHPQTIPGASPSGRPNPFSCPSHRRPGWTSFRRPA